MTKPGLAEKRKKKRGKGGTISNQKGSYYRAVGKGEKGYTENENGHKKDRLRKKGETEEERGR